MASPSRSTLRRQPVEAEVADLVAGRRLRRAGAAGQHFDAGEQFGEGVGLGQIVVAAGAQAGDAVVDLAQGGEDQHRGLVVLGPQRLDDRQAVAARQHAVDDQHVVVHARGHGVAGFAIGGVVGDMAGFVERLDQVARRLAVVFDQQDLHDAKPSERRWGQFNEGTGPGAISAPGPEFWPG